MMPIEEVKEKLTEILLDLGQIHVDLLMRGELVIAEKVEQGMRFLADARSRIDVKAPVYREWEKGETWRAGGEA